MPGRPPLQQVVVPRRSSTPLRHTKSTVSFIKQSGTGATPKAAVTPNHNVTPGVSVDTVGFQKIEPCEHGQVLHEDLTSRRLIFELLLVLHVVAVREDTGTIFYLKKCFSDRAHFHPTRCHHALHLRLAMDPCHRLTLFVIVFSRLWSLCWCSPGNSIMAASTGYRFARVSHKQVVLAG
ncbi:hypothetical protein HPB51_018663 [Rhipicephalus microplus]|uniref:Uncharacterized protein n=1 Tax=Rhipicephalus microplus TaxID=6941 RepID=A0A9J6DAT9_RHIMP|nr:hypothetical protein HPB51_018663 [Rhipicephalus microplus]